MIKFHGMHIYPFHVSSVNSNIYIVLVLYFKFRRKDREMETETGQRKKNEGNVLELLLRNGMNYAVVFRKESENRIREHAKWKKNLIIIHFEMHC